MNIKFCEIKNKASYKKYRTKFGFLITKYHSQIGACKQREHPFPLYTKDEFFNYWINHPKFVLLFNQWQQNGYQHEEAPSFDRKDNKKTYSFDNIQLVTWAENKQNYRNDKAYFSATFVIMYDMKNNKINYFNSMAEAERKTGISWRMIQKCCHGGRKSTHGFRFTFGDDNKKKYNRVNYVITKERKKIYRH